jgi:hypothetical protein
MERERNKEKNMKGEKYERVKLVKQVQALSTLVEFTKLAYFLCQL